MTSLNLRKWLLLIHQIPPKPNALRVKIWRRLKQIGAIAIKQSVYAMPFTEQSREDLSWTLKEIVEGGGDGSISEVKFVEGLNDEQVIALFQTARKADFEKIIQKANILVADWSSDQAEKTSPVEDLALLSKLQSRFEEIVVIDFFQAPERGTAEILLRELASFTSSRKSIRDENNGVPKHLKERVWVTRENVFVDRIACGWLIRRFVDQKAVFKFTSKAPYSPEKNELRFDMFDGEYTHEGDKCTFEVMIEKFQLQDKALDFMAQVIHDIDLKDDKYSRIETEGFKAVLSGLVAAQADDNLRLEQGFSMFENLYAYFHRHKD